MSQTEETMTDFVTKDFHKRIKAGEIINNPCWYDLSLSTVNGRGSKESIGTTNHYFASGGSITYFQLETNDQLSVLGGATVDENSAYDVAVAKLTALRNIDSTSYSFAEDLFEIRQTLRWLRRPLSSLRRSLPTFRKKVRRKAPRVGVVDAIRDTWLEYRFAFGPTVRSVDSFLDYLLKSVQRPPERRIARGFVKSPFKKDELLELNNHPGVYDYFDRSTEYEREVRVGVMYEVKHTEDYTLRQQLGLRNKDIPEALWAIAPYSFMVDRVANISASIRAVTNLLDPDVEIITGWVVIKSTHKVATKFTSQTNPGYAVIVSPDTYVSLKGKYERQAWHPSLYDTIPPVDFGGLVRELTQTADLVALLHSALSPSSYKRR